MLLYLTDYLRKRNNGLNNYGTTSIGMWASWNLWLRLSFTTYAKRCASYRATCCRKSKRKELCTREHWRVQPTNCREADCNSSTRTCSPHLLPRNRQDILEPLEQVEEGLSCSRKRIRSEHQCLQVLTIKLNKERPSCYTPLEFC